MLILLNILYWLAIILNSIVTLYTVILFARVVLSWVRVPYNQIVHIIYLTTEPVLRVVRRRLPLTGGIDFSPMIVFLLLLFVRMVIVGSILDYVTLYRYKALQG